MLRLQKPEPCVDLMPPAAWAVPIMPPIPMVMVIAAVAPFRNLRRDAAGAPEKSISCNFGKCIQPIRSHMTCLLDQSVGSLMELLGAWALTTPAGRRTGQPPRNCRHANRREPRERPALRMHCAKAVPLRCGLPPGRTAGFCCTARAQILVN